MTKTCKTCKKELTLDNFYRIGVYYQSNCKECFYRKYQKEKPVRKRTCRACKKALTPDNFQNNRLSCIKCNNKRIKKEKSSSMNNCFKCKNKIYGHPRCKRCTILIHNEKDYCLTCVKKNKK